MHKLEDAPRNIGAIPELLSQGNYLEAFSISVDAWRSGKIDQASQSSVVTLMSHLKLHEINDEVEARIIFVLQADGLALELVSPIVSALISSKFCSSEEGQIYLEKIAASNLLLLALNKILLVDERLELFLSRVRDQLIQLFAQEGKLQPRHLNLVVSLAQQLHFNEYIYLDSPTSLAISAELIKLLKIYSTRSGWTPSQSEDIIALLTLYYPLREISDQCDLPRLDIHQWPKSLVSLAKKSIYDSLEESEIRQNIPSLTKIAQGVSENVRAQYEESPYPRWTAISHQYPCPANTYIKKRVKNFQLPKADSEQVKVLVAGCGTGRQAITAAMAIANADVTAIDLSKASLAYGIRMARKMEVDNLSFYHGDILELEGLGGHFDMIFCAGVLHHMDDPLAGWSRLVQRLAPRGIMNIALYSAVARASVRKQRSYIEQLNIDASPSSIKKFRRALMARNENRDIIRWRDFWSLSECRDLLFHQREHQFSWLGIEEATEKLALKTVAVETDAAVASAFGKMFPDQASLNNLGCWHRFELAHPNAFSGMYNFWCCENAKKKARKEAEE